MKKVFITGSTTGLGFLEAKKLIADGNEVVLHARNEKKAQAVMQKLPGAKGIVVGDLSSMTDLKILPKKLMTLVLLIVLFTTLESIQMIKRQFSKSMSWLHMS